MHGNYYYYYYTNENCYGQTLIKTLRTHTNEKRYGRTLIKRYGHITDTLTDTRLSRNRSQIVIYNLNLDQEINYFRRVTTHKTMHII